ncbi:MAG: leucyl-tRNA synthetase [Patescibacteria group bacterium]|nr:leucine--tRNA ligase [Candidatus Saccharibacteria bacterium]MDQ5962971.1 leucyl-tRNA synthetase [Patescibacteria group bacterium]
MIRYNPKEIEPKWQAKWAADKTFQVEIDHTKPKKYIIDMFPYPSGAAMHVGHVRNFTISDVLSQYHRQKGYNVMHTMGWDTFGLPAENYAIKTGTPPQETTVTNIANFKHQLNMLGMSYDWSREINTSDPEYYRWTQWIFTQLFKKDLAYQAERAQWWCDQCKTVLANEQVVNGKCWRHDVGDDPLVTKRMLKQWFFKITDYADALLDGIDDLDWPEKIKTMQRNWIGKSVGAEVEFALEDSDQKITVFTTRPDTLFGATFLVLAPEHELVQQITTDDKRDEIEAYITEASKKSELERQENKQKTGVFTGAYAVNPAGGQKVPVWVADYVLTGYGTGAIMAVPAHDERDHEFAKQFDLPVVRVIQNEATDDECSHNEGTMMNSDEYDGMKSELAREKIVNDLEAKGHARPQTNYKMRDWLISRQRYWGAPIPVVHCPKDGAVVVPEDQLPVKLPKVESFAPTGNGSVLAGVEDWVNTICPACGGPAQRETDTMDGYACSSWYFLRYIDPRNTQQAWSPEKANYWMPVDYYCGGDHAVSHLLYSRFWFHFFADLGLIEKTRREPVGKLVYNGYILAHDGQKMSKSKGNVVNPDDLIEQGYGADSVRLFEMFIAPYEQNTNWNTNGVPGTYRFLQRFWNLCQDYLAVKDTATGSDSNDEAIRRTIHKAIKRVTASLDDLSFNTAVSALMECVNELYKLKVEDAFASREAWQFALESITQLLAPFAPHISEELWELLGHTDSVHGAIWPVFDEKFLTSNTVTYAVQINGKVRDTIEVAVDADQSTVEAVARQSERVSLYLANHEVVKTIFVPNKLISFVVS